MATKKFVDVLFGGADEDYTWTYEVPDFLALIPITEGTNVVVEHMGRLKLGRVSAVRVSHPYKDGNVNILVTAFNMDQYHRERAVRAMNKDLYAAAEARSAKVTHLRELSELAKEDAELQEILTGIAESDSDLAQVLKPYDWLDKAHEDAYSA